MRASSSSSTHHATDKDRGHWISSFISKKVVSVTGKNISEMIQFFSRFVNTEFCPAFGAEDRPKDFSRMIDGFVGFVGFESFVSILFLLFGRFRISCKTIFIDSTIENKHCAILISICFMSTREWIILVRICFGKYLWQSWQINTIQPGQLSTASVGPNGGTSGFCVLWIPWDLE